jgi:hypothetical protein
VTPAGEEKADDHANAQGNGGRLHRALLYPLDQVALGLVEAFGRLVVVFAAALAHLVIVDAGLLAGDLGLLAQGGLGLGGLRAQAGALLTADALQVLLQGVQVGFDVRS